MTTHTQQYAARPTSSLVPVLASSSDGNGRKYATLLQHTRATRVPRQDSTAICVCLVSRLRRGSAALLFPPLAEWPCLLLSCICFVCIVSSACACVCPFTNLSAVDPGRRSGGPSHGQRGRGLLGLGARTGLFANMTRVPLKYSSCSRVAHKSTTRNSSRSPRVRLAYHVLWNRQAYTQKEVHDKTGGGLLAWLSGPWYMLL